MMAVGEAFWKSRAVPRAKPRLSFIFDQNGLTVEKDEKFVFALVPMPLAGYPARLESDMADSEIAQSAGRRESSIMTFGHRLGIRRRIASSVDWLDFIELELRHGVSPTSC